MMAILLCFWPGDDGKPLIANPAKFLPEAKRKSTSPATKAGCSCFHCIVPAMHARIRPWPFICWPH